MAPINGSISYCLAQLPMCKVVREIKVSEMKSFPGVEWLFTLQLRKLYANINLFDGKCPLLKLV